MNPVYARLLEVAEDLGQEPPVPNTYFQELLSLSSGRISQISDPLSVAKIGPKGLSNLATLGFNPKWINDGPPHKKRLSPSSDTVDTVRLAYLEKAQQHRADQSDEVEISQFDTGGSMGNGVLLRDQPGVIQSWRVSPEWLQKNVRHHSGADNLCIVTGFGDSMRGMFEPGDPLLVDSGVRSVEFDAIYFFRVEGEGFIKRLQRIPGEGIRAISENKAYESWTIKPGMDFEVFGRVLKAWKSEDY